MRALWLTPGYPWPGNPVGFIFHASQALALAAQGVEVEVVAPTPWVPPGLAARNPRWAAYNAVPTHQTDGGVTIRRPRYLTTPRENQIGLAHLFQAIAVTGTPPDVIHAHFAYPCGAAGLRLKRRWGVPLVVTLHGDDVTIYPHYNRRMRYLFDQVIGNADRVIAVSNALAAQTEAMTGIRPDVLSTGINIDRFAAPLARNAARAALGIADGAFVALFVGALLPQKGVLELAAAFERLGWRDALCLFVGEGPARPAGPQMRLLGMRPNEDIPALLAAADVFVLPSWHEGLGQAAVEAGAAGVPLVVAETGGLAELAGDGCGLTFPPRDVGALASALAQVRADPAAAARRAERLREVVRTSHDLSLNAARLADIYAAITR